MKPRRVLFLGGLVVLVVNRRAVARALVRWTGTNVHTERVPPRTERA